MVTKKGGQSAYYAQVWMQVLKKAFFVPFGRAVYLDVNKCLEQIPIHTSRKIFMLSHVIQ